MIRVEGTITTGSARAECVAGALAPDNLSGMETAAAGNAVVTAIESDHLRSVTASVDDYLMNLAIAEEVCSYLLKKADRT